MEEDNLKQPQRQEIIAANGSSPWTFFVLALGWSWLFWIPLVALGWEFPDPRALVLFLLGGAGVPLAGILLTYLTQGKHWTGLGVLTGFLLGDGLPALQGTREFLLRPLSIIPFALGILFYGPVPEELGWRGYALDRLQSRWNALTASLILGVFWALWHVPQFFIKGLPIGEVFPVGTPIFWTYFIMLVPQSVLYTWVFNNNGRSILSAILFHFMTNFTGEFLNIGASWRLYGSLWIIVIAVIVVAIWGTRLVLLKTPRAEQGEKDWSIGR